ncbi:MAG TPA: hypothetical protein VMB49_12240 [Acidobacteriaceae bacterium]|nr:hypothetical protein [Acidobacteriaceae bacterium]
MTEKKLMWTTVAISAAALIGLFFFLRAHRLREISDRLSVPITGAVIQREADPNKQLPISDVVVTATDGVRSAVTQSDASGYFKLVLRKRVLSDQPITVSFQHPHYEPLEISVPTGRFETPSELHVVELTPIVAAHVQKTSTPNQPLTVVSDLKVRYTINNRTESNVGSTSKTFEVVNQGNVPCDHQSPCSPDGKWKAASKTLTLDAGPDNSYGNVSASCIAGPCPFTRIDSAGFIHGGRHISITALNWSDTATFLMEAEVYHTAINSEVRELYPVIFGQTLNFTLPPTQEGVSLEADINGAFMVFPLGPDLNLSWATCTARTGQEQAGTTVYRCELKPGYRFPSSS